MEFDKTKVYTVVDIDEVKISSKGYFSDSPKALKYTVQAEIQGSYGEVTELMPDNDLYVFCQDDIPHPYALFYLVEEPKNKKFRPYRDTAEMLRNFIDRFDLLNHDDRLPSIWIKSRINDICYFIVRVAEDVITIIGSTDCGIITLSMDNLFENYTYLDGSLCGIMEEE